MIQINLECRKRLTDLKNELMVAGGGKDGGGEEIVREFGMDMYTLLYLKWTINKAYWLAHETLLNVTWQPAWKGSLGENGYMYVYGQVLSLVP